MDAKRLGIVFGVCCLMAVTLFFLHKFAVKRESGAKFFASSSNMHKPTSVPNIQYNYDRNALRPAVVSISPPPVFFYALPSSEEDSAGLRTIRQRGQDLKPDQETTPAVLQGQKDK